MKTDSFWNEVRKKQEQIYCSYYCKDKEGKECTWKMCSCDVSCFYSPIEELKRDGMFCEFWDGSEE